MSTQLSELAIVKRIVNKLKLGEAGKIGNFFGKQVKNAEKAIRDHSRNKVTLENKYNDDVQDINDKIEDAEEALKDAYDNVTPEDVATNAAINAFEIEYWRGVKNAKNKLDDLKEQLKYLEESYNDKIKDINNQIALQQERIDVLKGK